MIPDLIDQFRIKGKVAVVTGASRGIGEGIAIGLADAGAHVIITARDHERLKTVGENYCGKKRKLQHCCWRHHRRRDHSTFDRSRDRRFRST